MALLSMETDRLEVYGGNVTPLDMFGLDQHSRHRDLGGVSPSLSTRPFSCLGPGAIQLWNPRSPALLLLASIPIRSSNLYSLPTLVGCYPRRQAGRKE